MALYKFDYYYYYYVIFKLRCFSRQIFHFSFGFVILVFNRFLFLSVQCNALHGTKYKITCGVCLCVCARTGFGAEYLESGYR